MKLSRPMKQSRPRPLDVLRLLQKVRRDRKTGCWIWQGYRDAKGYGQFWCDGKSRWAHRVAFAAFNGDVPQGRTVDHVCHCPSCVNPEHLRLLSIRANTAEGNRRRYVPF